MAAESKLEKYARRRVLAAGGGMYKWVCPGRRGAPDNIVFWERGVVDIVEFKAPGEELSPKQKEFIQELIDIGCRVRVLHTQDQVDLWISFRAPTKPKP